MRHPFGIAPVVLKTTIYGNGTICHATVLWRAWHLAIWGVDGLPIGATLRSAGNDTGNDYGQVGAGTRRGSEAANRAVQPAGSWRACVRVCAR